MLSQALTMLNFDLTWTSYRILKFQGQNSHFVNIFRPNRPHQWVQNIKESWVNIFRSNGPRYWPVRTFVRVFIFFSKSILKFWKLLFFASNFGPFFKIDFEKIKTKTDLPNAFSIAISKKMKTKTKNSKWNGYQTCP